MEVFSDFRFYYFFWGMVFASIINLLDSFTNYITEKAWLKNEYEEIIGRYIDLYGTYTVKEQKLICKAIINYDRRKKRRENLNKFLNKFKFKKGSD